jgi:hypothetical protein
MTRFVLTLFKAYYGYQKRTYLSVFLCLTGVVLWPLQAHDFKEIMRHRKHLFTDYVSEELKSCFDTPAEDEEPSRADGNNDTAAAPHKAYKKQMEELQKRRKRGVLTAHQRGYLKVWEKHFESQNVLGSFYWRADIFTKGFSILLIFIVVLNVVILSLEYSGKLFETREGHGLDLSSLGRHQNDFFNATTSRVVDQSDIGSSHEASFFSATDQHSEAVIMPTSADRDSTYFQKDHALAKEYLRCIAALKSCEETSPREPSAQGDFLGKPPSRISRSPESRIPRSVMSHGEVDAMLDERHDATLTQVIM